MEKRKRMRTGPELIRATKPYAQEDRRRSWWHFGSTLVVLLGLLSATCLNLPWFLRLPFSILASLVMIRMFVIYHDYLHGAILARSWLAEVVFRVFGLLMLAPASIWKHSHDHHHHHNGQYFAENMGGVWLMTTDEYAKANRWKRLGYAAVRHPFIILLGYVTIFVYSMCLHQLLTKPRRHLDAALALLIQAALIAALAVFAPGALVFTFLLPVLLADALGAYLFYAQHNYPDARFRDRPTWDYTAAALHSSSYLRMNPVMHWFTGNIGYHHVHHLNARIPFYRLPEAMAGIEELQSPGTTSLHLCDVYRCLRLKLWDPERNCLISFQEYRGVLLRGAAPAVAAIHRRPVGEQVSALRGRCINETKEPREHVMSIHCDVILEWAATPAQLTAVGNALWGWRQRAEGDAGVYHFLDNQALADLIAGRFPAASRTPWQAGPAGIHFAVRDGTFLDRQTAIDSLRRELPAAGIAGLAVDGARWRPADSPGHAHRIP